MVFKRISEANLKHGRYTKDKLQAQRHAAEVGRRVLAELKELSSILPLCPSSFDSCREGKEDLDYS